MEEPKETTWIKPNGRNPHTTSLKTIPLPPSDTYIFAIEGFWILPGPLDITKLKEAIGYALRDYYHCAGRLTFDSETTEWSIDLSDSAGIPLYITDTQNDGVVPGQTDVETYPGLMFEPTSWPADPEALPEIPLISMKVINWLKTGETSFHCSFCHALGDGYVIAGLCNSVSTYYQDLPPVLIPTFEKYLLTVPKQKPEDLDDIRPMLRWHDYGFTMDNFLPIIMKSMGTTKRMDVKFSPEDVKLIHTLVKKTTTSFITNVDALGSFLYHMVKLISPTPIHHIFQVLNYRGVPPTPGHPLVLPPLTSTGNCIVTVNCNPTELPNDVEPSMGSIAEMIRKSSGPMKDPRRFTRVLALATEKFETAIKEELFTFAPPDNCVFVNNFVKGAYHTQHFGYTGGRVPFLHCNAIENMFHIWPANPVKLSDGSFDQRKGGLDVQCRINDERRPTFLANIKRYLDTMRLEVKGAGATATARL